MKIFNLLCVSFFTILLVSCVAPAYYQVYKSTPSDQMIIKDNYLIYEDENCKILYNLWDDGGNIGFTFYNQTDNNIYLNLEESFFIINGIANNYYKNRIFSNTSSSGVSVNRNSSISKAVSGINYSNFIQTSKISTQNAISVLNTVGHSVSFIEEKIIIIPPKTSKIVSEYLINETLYRDCDLYLYPKIKKNIKSKTFTKTESPLIFSNRIAYSIGKIDKLIICENEFYVSQITNFPSKEIIFSKYDEFCGKKSMTPSKYFRDVSPDKFYIKYRETVNKTY